jgi:hypothetical protein
MRGAPGGKRVTPSCAWSRCVESPFPAIADTRVWSYFGLACSHLILFWSLTLSCGVIWSCFDLICFHKVLFWSLSSHMVLFWSRMFSYGLFIVSCALFWCYFGRVLLSNWYCFGLFCFQWSYFGFAPSLMVFLGLSWYYFGLLNSYMVLFWSRMLSYGLVLVSCALARSSFGLASSLTVFFGFVCFYLALFWYIMLSYDLAIVSLYALIWSYLWSPMF